MSITKSHTGERVHSRNREDSKSTDLSSRHCAPRRTGRARGSEINADVGELFASYQEFGDKSARDRLVMRYLPLARKLARQYARSSEPNDDLVQVASCALVRAVDRFDPSHGSDFAAFAVPTILGELKRYFRDSTWTLHVPRSIQERALEIDRASTHLSGIKGHSPTVAELADYLHISAEEVLDGIQAGHAYTALSLDAPSGNEEDDTSMYSHFLGAEDGRFELIDADVSIGAALRSLPARERKVLYLRFVGDMTQGQIADRIGVSQMQVSRLLRRSLARVREIVGASELS